MDEIMAAVMQIIKRGNDAVIRRKGNNIIVMEEKRKIIYDPSRTGGKEKQSEL